MKKYILLFLFSIIFISCGGYKTGVILKDHNGYLKFTGNLQEISIKLNDGLPFTLQPDVDQYELKPGTYNVKVIRNNSVIVERKIIIEEQITYEVDVP